MHDEFITIIEELKSFYALYDDAFNNVRNLFDRIDCNGGHVNDELDNIYYALLTLWESIMGPVNYDKTANQGERSLDQLVMCWQEGQKSFFERCKYNNKPVLMEEDTLQVQKMFAELNDTSIKNYSAVRLLYEYVSDALLIHSGLSKLEKWSFGTTEYSLLSTEEKLVVLLNQSILLDKLQIGHYWLEELLARLNSLIDSYSYLNWTVYYAAGFLNFKIHNYIYSERFFRQVVSNESLASSGNEVERKRFFHSQLLIAYGYEYQEKYNEAIKRLSLSTASVQDLLSAYPLEKIDISLDIIINKIREASEPDSLMARYFDSVDPVFKQITTSTDEEKEKRIEILHALSHCLNEMAIKERCALSGEIIKFSRAMLKRIASIDNEYLTCFATIHGECNDYMSAISELTNARKILTKDGIIRETLAAEIDFFEYYFSLMFRQDNKMAKKRFEDYCIKYADEDALCHLKIYEFRAKLRDALSKLLEAIIDDQSGDASGFNELPCIDFLSLNYQEIRKLNPSLYVNINVRIELETLCASYIVIDRFRTYLLDAKLENRIALINACKQYAVTRRVFDLSPSESSADSTKEKTCFSVIPNEAFETLFSSSNGILKCLNSSDTAFILAPISGIIVYQYQTGTLDSLFEPRELYSNAPYHSNKRSIDFGDELYMITESFHQLMDLYEPKEIHGVDVNWLKQNNVSSIFVLDEHNRDFIYGINQSGKLMRRLLNSDSVISKLESETSKRPVPCRNRGKRGRNNCKLFKPDITWTECINEHNYKVPCYVEKRTDEKTIYLIMIGQNNHLPEKCLCHDILDRVYIGQAREKLGSDSSAIPEKNELLAKIDSLVQQKVALSEKIRTKRKDAENYSTNPDDLVSNEQALLNKVVDELAAVLNILDEYYPEERNKLSIKYGGLLG